MRRFKFGLAVAAAVFIALAWIWPDGPDDAGEQAAAQPGAPASPTPTASPETSGPPPAEETAAAPGDGTEPAESEPADTADDTFDGPLGTRNHTGDDTVALTFDDGPDPDWTPQVLAELRDRGVKATFCIIGAYAEDYPDLVAEIVAEGHTLCNHAWFHEMDLGTWDEDDIRANLQRTNDAIQQASPGAEVEYFRQPGGRWTDRVISVAADLGMESLHWAVDPGDWDKESTSGDIRGRVLDRCGPGSVILLHDGGANQEDMLSALVDVLDEFEERGYTLVAL